MTVLLFGFTGAWNALPWPLLVTTKETWRPLMVGLWGFVSEAGPETTLVDGWRGNYTHSDPDRLLPDAKTIHPGHCNYWIKR